VKVYGGKEVQIFNFGATWIVEVSFTLRSFLPVSRSFHCRLLKGWAVALDGLDSILSDVI
jgi:hypothetical protein